MVVIRWGQGGRVDEHQQRFSDYRLTRAKIELRGPCYSACTMLTSYIEPENLCIAPGAFMAFHAVRGMARKEYMENEAWLLPQPAASDPAVDQQSGRLASPADGRLLDAVRSRAVGDGLSAVQIGTRVELLTVGWPR